MLCILMNNKDLFDIKHLCGTLLRTSYDIQQATRQHSEMDIYVYVCVCVSWGGRWNYKCIYIDIILLWKIHGSSVVMMLFNVCCHFFLSVYCIAHVYNRVSCVFNMRCVISGVCV